ncbi:hypothetical protein BDU57DRAFT_273201 [Ampelomyces quisqualis]|uniref:Uncharacterized protein n=1 Tax=Ampelomyces quisqualis TaxID=50730 RepID=A0A6A5QLS8_AMPQU|nr:hypothetical protein BDU57DRAFT_273201 [Ampelomyces quisqualis]
MSFAHLASWPAITLLRAAVFLLAPICTLLRFLLLPFIHLAHTVISAVTYPFSVQWLHRIETLYVYLGTAALVGSITGAIIFIVFRFLSSSLNINSPMVPHPRHRPRTTADFRAARRQKKEEEESLNYSAASTPVVLKRVPGMRSQGLLSQAIIEEEDSDF